MKLGIQGVSIFSASGDDGVTGFIIYYGLEYCGYGAQFPASSPYTTSVGATQAYPTENAAQANYNGTITTGGGFSQYYPGYTITLLRLLHFLTYMLIFIL